MHDAANEYENLPDGTSDEDAEKASQEFDTAQAETERAKSDVDKLERVARARADAPLPVDSSPEEKRHAGEVTTKEPLTYRKDNAMSQHYFRDLAKSDRGDHKAAERIQRHGREVEAERRDITRVDGAGGEFVPPLWLIDKYFDIARPARTTADLVSKMDLPGGTDSINIPRVTTGAAVAIQAADNANINEVDMVTATVNAPVRTIAGQEDVAMQLLDQSPIAFDQIVFKNLATSYAQQPRPAGSRRGGHARHAARHPNDGGHHVGYVRRPLADGAGALLEARRCDQQRADDAVPAADGVGHASAALVLDDRRARLSEPSACRSDGRTRAGVQRDRHWHRKQG